MYQLIQLDITININIDINIEVMAHDNSEHTKTAFKAVFLFKQDHSENTNKPKIE